jgi:hypothetical protein
MEESQSVNSENCSTNGDDNCSINNKTDRENFERFDANNNHSVENSLSGML